MKGSVKFQEDMRLKEVVFVDKFSEYLVTRTDSLDFIPQKDDRIIFQNFPDRIYTVTGRSMVWEDDVDAYVLYVFVDCIEL